MRSVSGPARASLGVADGAQQEWGIRRAFTAFGRGSSPEPGDHSDHRGSDNRGMSEPMALEQPQLWAISKAANERKLGELDPPCLAGVGALCLGQQ